MAWYGEKIGIKVKAPKMMTDYVRDDDIDKLIEVMRSNKTYR